MQPYLLRVMYKCNGHLIFLRRSVYSSPLHLVMLWVLRVLTGNVCMVTGGHNLGRVGLVTHRERHHGGFDIVHIKDSLGHQFATR